MITRITLGSPGLTVSAMGLGCTGMSENYGAIDWNSSTATIHRALVRGGIGPRRSSSGMQQSPGVRRQGRLSSGHKGGAACRRSGTGVHHGHVVRNDQQMPDLHHIAAPGGVAPGAGYSHVVSGRGRFVAVSGQVSTDEAGNVVGVGDPSAQAMQVFANLGRCLAAAGATFSDVVKLTFFMTDADYLPVIRAARDEVIDTARPPASSAVQVAALVRPEFLLEIEAFALVAD